MAKIQRLIVDLNLPLPETAAQADGETRHQSEKFDFTLLDKVLDNFPALRSLKILSMATDSYFSLSRGSAADMEGWKLLQEIGIAEHIEAAQQANYQKREKDLSTQATIYINFFGILGSARSVKWWLPPVPWICVPWDVQVWEL
jgi:hypothetical protein